MGNQLQLNLVQEINRLHSELCGMARTSLEKAIRIGELLTEQKAQLKHGEWLPWVRENIEFSQQTASNYVRLFQNREKLPSVGNLELTEAYRLLSQPADLETESESGALEAAPITIQPAVKCDIRQCANGHSYDAEKWDSKASGYECPYCWRDETAMPTERQQAEPAITITQEGNGFTIEKPHVTHNSGENEWYTPSEYLEAARAVMGSLDLDPASCDEANKRVMAERIFTKETNGLNQDWRGNVWMNPPYAQPLIGEFSEKVAFEFEQGKIMQACVLVNNATDTVWFHRMMQTASAVCFPKGRIRFIDKFGSPSGAPLQGQAVLYFGKNTKQFKAVFVNFGFVLSR